MSSLHPARRGAERFDSLLRGEQGSVTSTRDVELLELVSALQALPRPEPRPAFTADLRERLMVAAETDLVARANESQTDEKFRDLTDRLTVRTRRTPRERRVAIALGGFAMVGATTSMAVAAQHALPGDALYPLKRAMENAEAGFSVTNSAKGSTILENASGRLDEVRSLSMSEDVDAATVADTLDAFTEQAVEASELLIANYQATGSQASINELREFTSASIATLAALETVVPEEARDALMAAAEQILAIDGQAAVLCPECSSLGIITTPPNLVSQETSGNKPIRTPGRDEQPLPDQPSDIRTNDAGAAASTEPSSNPVVPDQNGGNPGTGNNPDGQGGGISVGVPSELPSISLPADPASVVGEVTEGVGDVVDGLLGGKSDDGKG